MQNYIVRDFKDGRELIRKGYQLDTIIPFEPRDFLIGKYDHEKMTTPELKEYIIGQRNRGVANINCRHRKAKGGIGLNIGIGLALSFSYILFMAITQSFAYSDLTSPLIAMWIPNIIYGVIAIILYRKAEM